MAIMVVKAMKISDNPSGIRIAYEKKGELYIRSGEDGFRKGIKAQSDLGGLTKWGFRQVQGEARFRDAQDIIDHIDKFQLDNQGVIKYYG